jgi:HSP20 family molecular chaperone IbpA
MKRNNDPDHLREHLEHLLAGRTHAHVPGHAAWHPPTDAFETEMEFVVRVDVAGACREDLTVVAEGRVLRIRGVRRPPPEGPRHYHKMEIRTGPFERHLRLPESCGVEVVATEYQEGILVVRLAKRPAGGRGGAGEAGGPGTDVP